MEKFQVGENYEPVEAIGTLNQNQALGLKKGMIDVCPIKAKARMASYCPLYTSPLGGRLP